MEINQLLLGCKVDIRIVQQIMQNNPQNDKKGVFYSTLYDINSDNTLELNMPSEAGRLQILPKNIRYEFIFTMDQGIYKADGTITEHLKKGSVYLLKAELTSKLEKIQRREYFRIACLLPMTFVAVDEKAISFHSIKEVKDDLESTNDFKVRGMGSILDISGGGARFVSSNSLSEMKYILMQFEMEMEEGRQRVETIVRLVSSTKMPDDNKYIHRGQFYFKDEKTKEHVIRFIFEEERRIRKKEQGI